MYISFSKKITQLFIELNVIKSDILADTLMPLVYLQWQIGACRGSRKAAVQQE